MRPDLQTGHQCLRLSGEVCEVRESPEVRTQGHRARSEDQERADREGGTNGLRPEGEDRVQRVPGVPEVEGGIEEGDPKDRWQPEMKTCNVERAGGKETEGDGISVESC